MIPESNSASETETSRDFPSGVFINKEEEINKAVTPMITGPTTLADLTGLSFAKIKQTGNDYDIFNGTCGAESGMIPVSAISPSIFVSEIEVEKKSKSQDKPPILPSPLRINGFTDLNRRRAR